MKILILYAFMIIIPNAAFSGECEKTTARESVICLEEKISFLTNSLRRLEVKMESVVNSQALSGQQKSNRITVSLPKRQWISVGEILPILDGNVSIVINEIEEYVNVAGRTLYANIQVDIPRRAPYKNNIQKSQSKKFDYRGKAYRLMVSNIDLQSQRAEITVAN